MCKVGTYFYNTLNRVFEVFLRSAVPNSGDSVCNAKDSHDFDRAVATTTISSDNQTKLNTSASGEVKGGSRGMFVLDIIERLLEEPQVHGRSRCSKVHLTKDSSAALLQV